MIAFAKGPLAVGRTGFRGRQVARVAEPTEEEEEDMWAIYYLLGALMLLVVVVVGGGCMFTAVQLAFLGSEETPLFTLAHEIVITVITS